MNDYNHYKFEPMFFLPIVEKTKYGRVPKGGFDRNERALNRAAVRRRHELEHGKKPKPVTKVWAPPTPRLPDGP